MLERAWQSIWILSSELFKKIRHQGTGPGNKWTIFLVLLFIYFLYHVLFFWNQDFSTEHKEKNLPTDQVAFMLIQEKTYGLKRPSFGGPLLTSLKVWDYDKDHNQVDLRFESLLPTDKSKAMVVYDRGFESFEKHAEVFSVNSFPYRYNFKSEPFISILGMEKDGTLYVDFKGTKIKLEPGDSKRKWSFDGFQVSSIKITNNGLYKKENFKFSYSADKLLTDMNVSFPMSSLKQQEALKAFAKSRLPHSKMMSAHEKSEFLTKAVLDYQKIIEKKTNE